MLQPSILLVEDDAFQRKAAETYLMNHDLTVIAVENGAQMRRQISRAMPDLVLLDVQLPGQEDGFALARCKSVLRRSVNKSTPSLLERVRMGQHTLDLPKRQLLDQGGKDVALTSGEFDILKTFAEHPNRPLSRDWLLETTSHRSRDPFDRAIDLRITRIRRKIEPTPDKPTVIRTVRGIGYMFVPPAE
jgi:DNA-binding response OmpR family regulator